jgi:hypothetical protein
LQSVPLAIIGVSYSLAAFPSLSKYFHSNQLDEFYANIKKAIFLEPQNGRIYQLKPEEFNSIWTVYI